MPMTTQPYQATEERKHLTTGGPGKEQGTNKLPATRILQRSTRGQQEMGDCSPEVLATSSEQQRPSIACCPAAASRRDRAHLRVFQRHRIAGVALGADAVEPEQLARHLEAGDLVAPILGADPRLE